MRRPDRGAAPAECGEGGPTPAPDGLPAPRGSVANRPAAPGPLPYRVVATDLDGTLLRSDLTFSLRTRHALKLATGAGARHLVVTGRPASSCREFLLALGYEGLAVCGQGAQLYDATADRLLTSAALDLARARALTGRLERELGALELGVVTAAPANRCVTTAGFIDPAPRGSTVVTDRRLLWAEPIEKVLLRHPALPDGEVAAAAERLGGGEVTVVHSQRGMVEILPAGITKAAGLTAAAGLLGFTAAETIAFGDMPNDLSMLGWAGHGVAMANAHPELRAVADEIAPANDADGVAAVLERLFDGADGVRGAGDTGGAGSAAVPAPRRPVEFPPRGEHLPG